MKKIGRNRTLLACFYIEMYGTLRSFEMFLILPIGTPSLFFSFSQWETLKMFHMTSDATHTFQ